MPTVVENKCRTMVLYKEPRFKTPSLDVNLLKTWLAMNVLLALDGYFRLENRRQNRRPTNPGNVTPIPWNPTLSEGWDRCQLVARAEYDEIARSSHSDGKRIEQAWAERPFLLLECPCLSCEPIRAKL
ncbi:hypothetical protein B0H11DRAFT_2247746 [Mycena galericulata]|nr:hypothetical protein B0H11DRAFT_2247742 [Mycena galericulata]KAJ7448459.1 hypothetical protein B0H11DRAFT_2247746 [Mycena galericulata]